MTHLWMWFTFMFYLACQAPKLVNALFEKTCNHKGHGSELFECICKEKVKSSNCALNSYQLKDQTLVNNAVAIAVELNNEGVLDYLLNPNGKQYMLPLQKNDDILKSAMVRAFDKENLAMATKILNVFDGNADRNYRVQGLKNEPTKFFRAMFSGPGKSKILAHSKVCQVFMEKKHVILQSLNIRGNSQEPVAIYFAKKLTADDMGNFLSCGTDAFEALKPLDNTGATALIAAATSTSKLPKERFNTANKILDIGRQQKDFDIKQFVSHRDNNKHSVLFYFLENMKNELHSSLYTSRGMYTHADHASLVDTVLDTFKVPVEIDCFELVIKDEHLPKTPQGERVIGAGIHFNLEVTSEARKTPLMLLMENKMDTFVTDRWNVLEKDFDKADRGKILNAHQDANGYTHLMTAIRYDYIEIAEEMISEASATNIQLQDKNGFNALHLSLVEAKPHPWLAERLVDKIRELRLVNETNIKIRNKTPLMQAAMCGECTTVLQRMIEAGFIVRDEENSALFEAAKKNMYDNVNFLMCAGETLRMTQTDGLSLRSDIRKLIRNGASTLPSQNCKRNSVSKSESSQTSPQTTSQTRSRPPERRTISHTSSVGRKVQSILNWPNRLNRKH